MNWTGGRLQRHSNNNGVRAQKQRFAKSRLNRDGAQLSPFFQGWTQLREADGSGGLQQHRLGPTHQVSCKNFPTIYMLHLIFSFACLSNQSSSTSSTNASPAIEKSTQALNRLDRIKRKLLDTDDWAGIAATRPVKMSFTPTQELERFGKRRKLTEADHDRLVSSGRAGHFDPSMSYERTRRAPSEFGTIGDLDIRIHGPRVNAEYLGAGQSRKNNESSQPMLLDRRESDCVDQDSPVQLCDEMDRERTHSSLLLSSNEGPSGLSLSQRPSSFIPSRTGSPDRSVSQSNEEGRFINRSSPLIENSQQPNRCLVSSSPDLHHPMPQPLRRFTIDDQVAAELEAESNAVGALVNMPHYQGLHENDITSSYASELQPEQMQGLELTAPDTQSTSSNQCSGWLPEPRHQIQRFVGQAAQRDTPFVATPSKMVEYGRGTHRDKLGPRTNNRGHYTSPVKLFGQTVAIDSGTMDSTQDQKHKLYQWQPGALPTQYITPIPRPAMRMPGNISPETFFGQLSTDGPMLNIP